jgi:hypothetical protein
VCGAGLGRCLLATGPIDEGEGMLRQALEIFQRIGAAETAEVSAELHALTDADRPRMDHDFSMAAGQPAVLTAKLAS